MNALEVDMKGFRQLFANRPVYRAIEELISNAFDEKGVTRVDVTLNWASGYLNVQVIDDAPDGFRDMKDAYTLFASSYKKDNLNQRGRFNFGEKWVVARATWMEIKSTTGCVTFENNSRRVSRSNVTDAGTAVTASFKINRVQCAEIAARLQAIIVPLGIRLRVDTDNVTVDVGHRRDCICVALCNLPTVGVNEAGELITKRANTEVEIYPAADKQRGGCIYEMGIPIVYTGDLYDANVRQKVPQTLQRDNVTPKYLAELRAVVLENTAKLLTEETASATCVVSVLDRVSPAAVNVVLDKSYGEKRVVYDPTDTEASNRAVAEGYAVIHGGAFSREVWDNIRRSDAAQPAGQVFPTPQPYGTSPGAKPVKVIPRDQWPDGAARIANIAEIVAEETLGCKHLEVRLVDTNNGFVACCGPEVAGVHTRGRLDFNVRRLGKDWFLSDPETTWQVMDLIIHELAHIVESNHLSEAYYDALTMIAGKWAAYVARQRDEYEKSLRAALESPQLRKHVIG